MKRWKKVLLTVVVVLAAAVAALAIWQRDNLKAVHTALTTDREILAQDMQEKADKHQKVLEDSGVTVIPPSVQQNEDLIDGKVSADEVKDALGIAVSPTPNQEPVPSGVLPSAAPVLSAEELLNSCVAELYACQIDLMAQLGEMKQAAIDQWTALAEEERTDLKKQEIGMAGLRQCYDLEAGTDAAVKDILAQYRAQLEQIGADTGQLDELWVYYCEEKEAQKAFYLNKYLN